ncbi:Oidioi.mRNA.OKI2018_I69.XSR.g16303.t1.cds [Oikopleura dioica]|uniref:Oidioi.mRNA.OKI2018_I69.XSR.g16303.t1.cds n=1 Tax=Oikopleura dioica TaxID=34765 RepID=A0ABN7SHI1_OIKDI|nr:Oidioi.mRNA.OKI2018_I69.XSR.g16303.t1.cds [Oikopleura dioica]
MILLELKRIVFLISFGFIFPSCVCGSASCGKAISDGIYDFEEPDKLTNTGKRLDADADNGFFKENGQYVNPVGNSSTAAAGMVLDAFECLMDEALPKSFPWHVAIYSIKTRPHINEHGIDWNKHKCIFMGFEAKENQFKKQLIMCSGVLIHPKWILTSGSCLMRKIVILGGVTDIQRLKHKLNTGEAQRRFPLWSGRHSRKEDKGAYRPPQHEERAKFKHNIALIRDEKTSDTTIELDEPFEENEYVKPICLPERSFDLDVGTTCVVTGYKSKPTITTIFSSLMHQISSVRPLDVCNGYTYENGPTKMQSDRRAIDGTMCVSAGCVCMRNGMPFVCTVENTDGSVQYVLSGIKISDGKNTKRQTNLRRLKDSACGRWPRLFVPVAPYVDWIHSVIDGTFRYSPKSDASSDLDEQEQREFFNSDSYDQVDDYDINNSPIEEMDDKQRNPQRSETLRHQEVLLPQSTGIYSHHSALTEEDRQLLELVKKMNQEKVVSKGCLDDNDPIGFNYRGGANFINAGIPCMDWSETRFKKEKHPNKGLDANYCRNPDRDPKGPWCVYWAPVELKKKFGYCDIPKCS